MIATVVDAEHGRLGVCLANGAMPLD